MTMEPTTSSPTEAPPRMPWGALLFCVLLIAIGCVFLGLAIKRHFFPTVIELPPMQEYDLAGEAKKLVRKSKPEPLSAPLAAILEEAERVHFDTYKHPLVGQRAPEISGKDVDDKPWELHEALKKGPVVVVFYLGYYCNHCVSQLFDLNEDIDRFRELGAEVVALSPDAVEVTRERYKQYGAFKFPVLADRGNKIAETFGVFTPPRDGKTDQLLHGTFVIDQHGVVRWAAFGETPFGHNPTLLYELAKIKGRVK